jgi:hypothetical protein
MALVRMPKAPKPVAAPKHRLLEEGPVVVEYYVTPIAPSLWVAHAEVLRGIPDSARRNLHPRFTGTGSTESEARRALLRELERFLDDPFWQDFPCH